ncbi:MAG: hypothetical protein ACI8Z7_000049 [Candidatus Nanohaloarchaea archaeon]
MEGKKYRTAFMATAMSAFSVLVSGQITGSTGNPEEQLIELFNQVLFTFEAQSIADIFLFFILPLFGFYFINKNIFEIAFENFHERIGRDEWAYTDDELPTGVKGLSFVVAFMTVQIFGAFGTWLLVSTAGLAFAAWALSYMGLLNLDREGNEAAAEDAIREVAEEEEEGEEALDDMEEDEADGDTGTAEHDFEHALRAFEGAEEDLIEILEYDEHELIKIIQKAEDAVNDSTVEKGKLSTLHDRMDEFQKRITALSDSIGNDPDNNSLQGSDFQQTWDDKNLDNITDMADQINGHINNVKKLELKGNQEVRDELDDLIRETKRIKRLAQFLDRLDHDLSRLKNDEQRLEKMVQQGKEQGVLDDNFVERLMGDKRKMRDLASNLDNLEQELDSVMPTLKKLINNLEGHVTIGESEVDDLIKGGSNVVSVGYMINTLDDIADRVEDKYADGGNNRYTTLLRGASQILQDGRVELNDMKNSIESGESNYVSQRLEQLEKEYNEIVN